MANGQAWVPTVAGAWINLAHVAILRPKRTAGATAPDQFVCVAPDGQELGVITAATVREASLAGRAP